MSRNQATTRNRAMIRASVWLLLFASLVGGWRHDATMRAAEPAAVKSPSPPPLRFRRVYVPQDLKAELVRGSIPVKEEEFQRLLKLLQSSSAAPAEADARIIQAEYSARLEQDELVAGEARLDVAHQSDAAVSLSFDSCGLAIADPVWEETPPRPAIIGLAADGKLNVLVEKPSRLVFPWTLHGTRDPFGAVDFDVRLPACPTNKLTLDLPAGTTPIVDRGLVRRITPLGEPGAVNDPIQDQPGGQSSGQPGAAPAARHTWLIELGGQTRVALRVAPARAQRQQQQFVLLRQALTYSFAESGLKVSSELTLDVHNQPLDHLLLNVDPSLRVTSARLGDRQLPVTLIAGPDQQLSQVLVEFPEPILATDRVLQLSAVAPLITGQTWTLPGIRPQDVFWQEGTAKLLVAEPLSLTELETAGCRQTTAGPLSAPSAGESLQFQYFTADSAISLTIQHRPSRLRLVAGTSIRLDSEEMNGRVVADFAALEGEQFLLQANVPKIWIVDAVESQPPEVLDDWTVAPDGAKRQLLEIRLNKAIDPQRRVRIIVRAHGPLPPPGSALGMEQFRLAEFRNVGDARHLMVLQTVPPLQLAISEDADLTRLDAQRLSAEDSAVVDAAAGGVLLLDDPATDSLVATLRSEQPRFSAEVAVEATVSADSLTETYRIQGTPESTPVGRLLVQFFQARPEPLRWTMPGEDDRAVAARRLTEAEQQAAIVAGGETWELILRQPRDTPFEVRASRTTSMGAQQTVSLASLPEAATQLGALAIHSSSGAAFSMIGRGLKAVPAEALPPGRYPTMRAAYRYEPSQDAAITITRTTPFSYQPTAWAWSSHLVSHFTPAGARHTVVYRIENTGQPQIALTLPAEVTLVHVAVDDTELPLPALSAAQRTVAIPLPAGVRYPTVSLTCTTEIGARGIYATVGLPLPSLDIPVLARHWTAWLPPGYAPLDDRRQTSSSSIAGGHHWRQRLLGPLKRPPHQRPFDLFSGDDWNALVPRSQSDDPSCQSAERFLSSLGQLMQTTQAVDDQRQLLTWQQLLVGYRGLSERESEISLPQLLIDGAALAAMGVIASGELPDVAAETDLQRGAALLERANLVVLARPDVLLLTSREGLAVYANVLEATSQNVVATVRPSSLYDELSAAIRSSSRYVDVEAWSAETAVPQSPWLPRNPAAYAGLADTDWTVYESEVLDGHAARLRIYHPQAWQVLSWAALLVTVALVWLLAAHHPRRLVAAAAATAILALLAPQPYDVVTTGMFLGTLAGGVLVIARRPVAARIPTADRSASTRSASTASVQLSMLLLALGAAVIATKFVSAQEAPAAANTGESSPIYRVVIPIDEQRNPVGGYVFLPQPFYTAIHQRAAALKGTPRGWLIGSATYRCVLDREASDSPLDVEQFTVQYEIEVFQPNARVLLPLRRTDVNLLGDQSKLDGQPIQIDWEADDKSLALTVANSGKHQLELALYPTRRSGEPLVGFDMAIPRLPRSLLHVVSPADVLGIQFPTAKGAQSKNMETGEVSVQLGPTDRLAVRWPTAETVVGKAAEVEAEELLWLKLRPSSVVIDAQFKFAVHEGQIREVQIAADPRLRMLPLRPEEPVARSYPRDADGSITVFELKQPFGKEVTIHASFLLTGASGVGNLRLPRLETLADRHVRRWLAVSVNPVLNYEPSPGTSASAVAVSDFSAAWGKVAETVSAPQLAYQLPRGETMWSLATRPAEVHATVTQQTDISIAGSKTEVRFDAQLNAVGGYYFQHRLTAPKDLEIRSVSVRENNVQRAVRWSPAKTGMVTVFLNGPVTGEHRLTLEGVITTGQRNKIDLPRISVVGATVSSNQFHIYRRHGARATVSAIDGMTHIAGVAAGTYQQDMGRLVAALEAANDSSANKKIAATIAITPNRPQVACRQITTLQRNDGTWDAQVDCNLTIESGVIDVLRFEIPAEIGGPFVVEPESESQIVSVPGQSRRWLVIRPPQAITGQYHLRIQSVFSTVPGQRVAAPDIALLDVRRLDRFLVVPTQLETQQIAWETSGLQAVPLVQPSDAAPLDSKAYASYEVVGPRFQAIVRHVERVSGVPQVRLADIHVAWREDRSCNGVATFDLEPAGLTNVTLELPPACRLIQSSVADVPATLTALGDNQWHVALGPDQLPQRIAVVFAGRLPADTPAGPATSFVVPQLLNVPVERSLWTVYSPDGMRDGRPVPLDSQIDALRQESFRLKVTSDLVDLAVDVASESAPKEIVPWYLRWTQRYFGSRNRLALLRLHQRGAAVSDAANVEALEQDQAAFAARLGTTELRNQIAAEPAPPPGTVDVWSLTQAESGEPATRCIFQGAVSRLEVNYDSPPRGDLPERAVVAWSIVGISLIVYLLLLRGAMGEWFVQKPHALGVLIGLAWWLWLAPSILGWVIVLVSILGALRFPWPAGRIQSSSSTAPSNALSRSLR
jgi:hypothetical protein